MPPHDRLGLLIVPPPLPPSPHRPHHQHQSHDQQDHTDQKDPEARFVRPDTEFLSESVWAREMRVIPAIVGVGGIFGEEMLRTLHQTRGDGFTASCG